MPSMCVTSMIKAHFIALAWDETDLIDVVKGVEDVVGQTGQQVDHEPAAQVVHADDPGV